jgi:hypothetical protein
VGMGVVVAITILLPVMILISVCMKGIDQES